MVGILLVTHIPIGQAFIQALTDIFGHCPPQLAVLDIENDTPVDTIERKACEFIKELDQGDGVLMLTDIMGSTPSNCVSCLLQKEHVQLVAGLNLTMLLRVLTHRDDGLEASVRMALLGGKKGVVQIT